MNTLIKRNNRLNPMSDVLLNNQWFEDFFKDAETNQGLHAPKADILEQENQYLITIALPGLSKKDIKIDLLNQKLSVSGSYHSEESKSEERYIRKELHTGSFHREFKLGNEVDHSKIDASFKNGLLEIILPKSEKASPKVISIK